MTTTDIAHSTTATRESRGRAAYLVLGMHRSGTSAVTQLLALAGAQLPRNVMQGDEHNAKGYFEPLRIAAFNDARLRAAGSAWDDVFAFPCPELAPNAAAEWRERARALFVEEFGEASSPLLKDPRVTVLLPFWRETLADLGLAPRCVVPVRHPLAVASSLARRNRFAPQKSVLLWTAYMLAAEAYSRDLPRVFIGYDALLADWRAEAARIEGAHGAPLPALDGAAAAEIDSFLTPELRHNRDAGELASLGWTGRLAERVHAWFAAAARDEAPPRAELDLAAAEFAERQREIGPLVSPTACELDETRHQLYAIRAEVAEVGWALDALLAR